MGKTKISWTDAVWNPVVGCSVVSPGCKNCYAMNMAHRHASNPKMPHYAGTTARTAGSTHWTGLVNSAPDHILMAPLGWKKPRLVFVNSMSDLFHESVSDDTIDQIFAVMALCPQHTFQILTKRADRMREYMQLLSMTADDRLSNAAIGMGFDDEAAVAISNYVNGFSRWRVLAEDGNPLNGTKPYWPLPNCWLGVSVEDQKRAEERIPMLLTTPAAVRWVSAEPLLGEVDLTNVFPDNTATFNALTGKARHLLGFAETVPSLNWLVCGGESGPKARPMHPDWARSLRDQCVAADVPFFFKQWGEWAPGECAEGAPRRTERCAWENEGTWDYSTITPRMSEQTHRYDAPDVYRFGKKQSGRLLDGKTWDQYPSPVLEVQHG